MDFFRRSTWFASSDGAAIEQVVLHSGGGTEATAVGDGDMQRRSYPNSFRGHVKAAGYEHIRTLGLIEEAERIGREAVDLLNAPECPSEVTTLVLDSGQMELQIHESIGHPIELDRVLGMEEAYAGSSWLQPEDRGKVRYASDLVSITADAHASGRARHVRVRRRRRAGPVDADHRRRHVRELPDLAGDRARWWVSRPTPPAVRTGGATCR